MRSHGQHLLALGHSSNHLPLAASKMTDTSTNTHDFGHDIIQYEQIHHCPTVLTHVGLPEPNSLRKHLRGTFHSKDTVGNDEEVEIKQIPIVHHSLFG